MSFLDASVLILNAFLWGAMFGEWCAKRNPNDDPAFKLLFGMLQAVREKRRFVGPEMQIIRTEKFEFLGSKYTLSLTGEPESAPQQARG
jgi:hypothetical protein